MTHHYSPILKEPSMSPCICRYIELLRKQLSGFVQSPRGCQGGHWSLTELWRRTEFCQIYLWHTGNLIHDVSHSLKRAWPIVCLASNDEQLHFSSMYTNGISFIYIYKYINTALCTAEPTVCVSRYFSMSFRGVNCQRQRFKYYHDIWATIHIAILYILWYSKYCNSIL